MVADSDNFDEALDPDLHLNEKLDLDPKQH
jgi:hypothetical protein